MNGKENEPCNTVPFVYESDGDDELLKDTKPIFSKRKRSPDNVAVLPTGIAPSAAAAFSAYFSLVSTPASNPFAGASADAPASVVADRKPKEHLAFLGSFDSSIVGAQNFRGQDCRGDEMLLERDLKRMHDRNAVQVLRTQDGCKRGYLPTMHAAVLAPMLDRNKFTCKVTVWNAGDGYMIPVVIDIYAKAFRALLADEVKQIASDLGPSLRNLDWKSDTEPTTAHLLKSLASDAEQSLNSLGCVVAKGLTPTQARADDNFTNGEIDMSEMNGSERDELDSMFDQIQAEQLADLPNLVMPKQFDAMELFDYQQNGIRWLYKQETQDDPPPFFRKVGPKWECTITNCKQNQQPPPIRGACLADDMGLGKVCRGDFRSIH